MTREELIAALEAAEYGTPKLDVEIELSLPLPSWEASRKAGKKPGRIVSRYTTGSTGSWSPRQYTTNLDAALCLVPDDHSFCIHRAGNSTAWHYDVELFSMSGAMVEGVGPSFALALCIAALRARGAA